MTALRKHWVHNCSQMHTSMHETVITAIQSGKRIYPHFTPFFTYAVSCWYLGIKNKCATVCQKIENASVGYKYTFPILSKIHCATIRFWWRCKSVQLENSDRKKISATVLLGTLSSSLFWYRLMPYERVDLWRKDYLVVRWKNSNRECGICTFLFLDLRYYKLLMCGCNQAFRIRNHCFQFSSYVNKHLVV